MDARYTRSKCKAFLAATAFVLSASACSLPNAPATKAAAAMSQPYSSGEILLILQTVNNAEIKQADMALKHSDHSMVQQVAKLIIQDHKASNERIERIIQTTSVKLDESLLNTGLRTQGNEIAENIANLSGQEFNCTYLQKQIEQHALVLKTVREQLIPSASQPQIQELLTIAAPKLEAHLKTAQGHRAHLQCPQA